eukprot:scaffold6314_cov273-Ochromonas_danica.AAC.24
MKFSQEVRSVTLYGGGGQVNPEVLYPSHEDTLFQFQRCCSHLKRLDLLAVVWDEERLWSFLDHLVVLGEKRSVATLSSSPSSSSAASASNRIQLEHLSLPKKALSIPYDQVNSRMTILGQTLTSLHLHYDSEITHDIFQTLVLTCPHLRSLRIPIQRALKKGLLTVTQLEIAIQEKWVELEDIYFNDSCPLEDKVMFGRCSYGRQDLFFTESNIHVLLAILPWNRLKHFALFPSKLTDPSILTYFLKKSKIIESVIIMNLLRYTRISSCRSPSSPLSILYSSNTLTTVSSNAIEVIEEVKDHNLYLGVGRGDPMLFETLATYFTSYSSCHPLRSLQLQMKAKDKLDVVATFLKCIGDDLINLDIRGFIKGGKILQILLALSLPKLEGLHYRLDRITQKEDQELLLQYLQCHGYQLSELSLWNCANVTDEILVDLLRSGVLVEIKRLELWWCKKLTDHGVHEILCRCPKLSWLRITDCGTKERIIASDVVQVRILRKKRMIDVYNQV